MKIDEESCIGCGLYATLYPERFEIGKDGHSHIKKNIHIDNETLQKLSRNAQHLPYSRKKNEEL